MDHTHHTHSTKPEPKQPGHSNQKYTCPMHPQIIKDEPGKCPICGMKLVPLAASKNDDEQMKQMHDKHAGHHTEDFLRRFWVSLILTVPVLLLSEMIQHWLGFEIKFSGDKYVLLILSSFIFFYGGWPF